MNSKIISRKLAGEHLKIISSKKNVYWAAVEENNISEIYICNNEKLTILKECSKHDFTKNFGKNCCSCRA